MAEYEPLNEQDSLSQNELDFIRGCPLSSQSRLEILLGTLIGTHRPTNPGETIFNGYMRLEKFHDREPELVVIRVEAKCPHYFENMPRKNEIPTMEQKKRIVGRATKQFVKFAGRQYGKPKLRV